MNQKNTIRHMHIFLKTPEISSLKLDLQLNSLKGVDIVFGMILFSEYVLVEIFQAANYKPVAQVLFLFGTILNPACENTSATEATAVFTKYMRFLQSIYGAYYIPR